MYTPRQLNIIWKIFQLQPVGISGIKDVLIEKISVPTLNRELAFIKNSGLIEAVGNGPGLKYIVNKRALMFTALPVDEYFKKDADDRQIFRQFNREVFEVLGKGEIFSTKELARLNELTKLYQKKIKGISPVAFKKEFERLMIELSWKSAQIEGNTYDLLDTEQLLKYNVLSKKHTEEEAIMLLNHKAAIEYSYNYSEEFKKLSIRNITELHTLLTKKLGVKKNLRKRIVRITGTNYTPPENGFLIEEYLDEMVKLVNAKKNVFEKALLTVLMISYIQPFEDGNKRTSRITANALLMGHQCCPLSYRSINPTDYKKAILLFYEINNLSAFKEMFIEQYEFAVNTYF